jgi:hypothetical protein
MDQLPKTTDECGGCDEELNLLHPHLVVQIKAARRVLVVEEEVSEDPNVVPDASIYLGDKSGRGRIIRFHDFKCMNRYTTARKDHKAVIMVHAEEGEPYEPEDNRSPEQLVKDGVLAKEMLAVHAAAADVAEGGDN